MDNKKKITTIVITIAAIVVSLVAGTFAYFTITGANEKSQDITVTTIDGLIMTLKDGGQTGISGVIDATKLDFVTYFTIENEGQGPQYAKIMFKNLKNTYSEDLVYKLEEIDAIPASDSETPTVIRTVKTTTRVPENKETTGIRAVLAASVPVEPSTTDNDGTIHKNTQYYRLTILYQYSDSKDQTVDANAEFYTELDMETGSAPANVRCVNASNEEMTCGTITTGTKIAIGTEKFYVISNNAGTIRALAEYNLNVGTNKVAGATEGLQNVNAKGFVEQATYPEAYNGGTFYGTVSFYNGTTKSASAYTAYNADETTSEIAENTGFTNYTNSDVKALVDAYKTKINGAELGKGIVTDVDLITFNELKTLGCTASSSKCNNTGVSSWVYQTSYLTASAASANSVWGVTSAGALNSSDYNNSLGYGVRPVITLSATSFQ